LGPSVIGHVRLVKGESIGIYTTYPVLSKGIRDASAFK
jgi:hypothetical protein